MRITVPCFKRWMWTMELNNLRIEHGKQQDLIDYILIRANEAWVQCGERKIKVLQKRWHAEHKDLSDHYSVETEAFFQSPAVYAVTPNK